MSAISDWQNFLHSFPQQATVDPELVVGAHVRRVEEALDAGHDGKPAPAPAPPAYVLAFVLSQLDDAGVAFASFDPVDKSFKGATIPDYEDTKLDVKTHPIRPTINLGSMIYEARRASGTSRRQIAEHFQTSENRVWELEQCRGTISWFEAVSSHLFIDYANIAAGQTFGHRVVEHRKKAGWSRAELAEKAGMSPTTLKRVEANAAHLSSLAKVLGVLAPDVRPRKRLVRQPAKLRDVRYTPPDFLSVVMEVLGEIDLDPAAGRDDHVPARRKFFENGLDQSWKSETLFCNPPYSCHSKFLARAVRAFVDKEVGKVFMLMPARYQTDAWYSAAPHADIFLLKRRIRFWDANGPLQFEAPFASAAILFGADDRMISIMQRSFEALHFPRAGATGVVAVQREAAG